MNKKKENTLQGEETLGSMAAKGLRKVKLVGEKT